MSPSPAAARTPVAPVFDRRRARCTLALFVAAAAAFAADKPAPPGEKHVPPPPTEDAIAAAKRDFDAVKAARNLPAPATGAALPGFAPPEFPASAPARLATPASRADAALAAKKKSANWLVEAMNETREKGRRAPLRGERDETGRRFEPFADDTQPDEPVEKEKSETTRRPHEPVANPLDRYMAAWMSPQDLALLRPALRGGGLPERGEAPLAGFGTDLSGAVVPAGPVGGLSSAGPKHAAPIAARENPFLQSLAPPPVPRALAAPPPAAPPPAAGILAPPPGPPPAQKSVTPSFVKPRDDEKYYKQMKRF